jgi:hypothetical protein
MNLGYCLCNEQRIKVCLELSEIEVMIVSVPVSTQCLLQPISNQEQYMFAQHLLPISPDIFSLLKPSQSKQYIQEDISNFFST